MGHDVVFKEQILPIAQDPFQNVTTVLICQNILLRAGISHILSGTRFVLADETCVDLSRLPAFADKVPVLFLICENRSTDDYVALVEELKTQCSSARAVILADAMEPEAVMQICRAGLDGFCPTSMERHVLVKALEIVMLGETFIPATIGLSLVDRVQQELLARAGSPFGLSPANDPVSDPALSDARRLEQADRTGTGCGGSDRQGPHQGYLAEGEGQ
jgi:two-component system nitrate/nitrite response regulator NarL